MSRIEFRGRPHGFHKRSGIEEQGELFLNRQFAPRMMPRRRPKRWLCHGLLQLPEAGRKPICRLIYRLVYRHTLRHHPPLS
jgi:hypothetical protein